MHTIILRNLLIFLIGVHGAVAQNPTPRPNPARYVSEIAAFAKQEPEKGGIVFTGSSNIRLWPNLHADFPGLPVLNRGFGGCLANDLIVFFETIVARHEPKIVVTYAGGNDLEEKLTVQEAFGDYTQFLTAIHERLPKTRVILNSVKIAPRRALRIPQVHEFNRLLETWATGKDWVRFLDSSSYLADPLGQPVPAYFSEDQLHLTPAGYAQWQAILAPVLREEWAKVK